MWIQQISCSLKYEDLFLQVHMWICGVFHHALIWLWWPTQCEKSVICQSCSVVLSVPTRPVLSFILAEDKAEEASVYHSHGTVLWSPSCRSLKSTVTMATTWQTLRSGSPFTLVTSPTMTARLWRNTYSTTSWPLSNPGSLSFSTTTRLGDVIVNFYWFCTMVLSSAVTGTHSKLCFPAPFLQTLP